MAESGSASEDLVSSSTIDSFRSIRQRFAINQFKNALLGSEHRPGEPQTTRVLAEIERLCGPIDWLDPRTWSAWHTKNVRIHSAAFQRLEAVAGVLRSSILIPESASLPRDYFRSLLDAGLLATMTAPTKSKAPLEKVLQERAREHSAISTWHLHLDAIEVCAIQAVPEPFNAQVVRKIAAERILELLHQNWLPDADVLVSTALPLEKRRIESSCRRVGDRLCTTWTANFFCEVTASNLTKMVMRSDDFDVAPCHAHRLLLSVARDVRFLHGPGFSAWSIDQATAALAMMARAIALGYLQPGIQGNAMSIYWPAFAAIYFKDADVPMDPSRPILNAMANTHSHWPEESFQLFQRAGTLYRHGIAAGGLMPHHVAMVAEGHWSRFVNVSLQSRTPQIVRRAEYRDVQPREVNWGFGMERPVEKVRSSPSD